LQAGAAIAFDTTGGTFTQGNAIANSTGAFGGAIGLTKIGTGTLILDQTNTYTGPTAVSAGTLQLGSGTAAGSLNASGVINVASGATFAVNQTDTVTQGTDIGSVIFGAGSVANLGSGTLVLNAPNFHTGNTTPTAGNITLSHARAIQFSALNTTGAGTVTLSGVTAPVFGGLANSGTTRNLASVITTGYGSVTNLTLNPQSGSSFTYGGVIANGAADMNLTKTGAGTQILSGNNTYTGETFLNGGTLSITGAAGALSGTTGITLNGGTLTLGTDLNNNRVNDSANITSNGGTIAYDINNSSTNTETVGTLDLVRGQFNLTEAYSISSGSSTFSFSGLIRTGVTNTSAVNLQAKNTAFSTGGFHRVAVGGIGANTPAGEIVGPWMTTTYANAGASDYVVYSNGGSGSTYYAIGANITASAQSAWSTDYTTGTLNNTLANASGSAANGRLTADRNINSLRNTTTATTVTANGTTETFTLTAHGYSNGDVVNASGTGGLTSGVPYYVINAAANTFQLSTTPGGSVALLSNNTNGAITPGVSLGAFNLGTLGILNGSTVPLIIGGTGGAVTLPTTTAGNLYVTAGIGSIFMDAPINNNTGALTLVKNGSNTLTLRSTSSTYSGGTVINAGTLSYTADTALGAGGSRNITFDGTGSLTWGFDGSSLGTLTVNVGAVGTLTSLNNITFATTAGSGTIRAVGGQNKKADLGNASTFTGDVALAYNSNNNSGANAPHIQFSSLNDAAGSSIQFYRQGGGTDSGQVGQIGLAGNTGSLTFNNRQIQLLAKTGGTGQSMATNYLLNNNGTAANKWVINTDLLNLYDRDSTLGLGGTNTGDNAFNGLIGNSNFSGAFGTGTGVLSLAKTEAGKWILGNTANTYTGATTVSAGTLEVKSLANGGLASSIGASSNAAGNLLLANGTTLRYTGTGHSTNRGFTINGTAAGHSATLDASGTGAVNWTNTATPAYGTTAQTRTLNLTGTNTGNNTLAANIANNGGSAVSLAKTGVGTWVLSGSNTATGTSNLSGGGKLILDYGTSDNNKIAGVLTLNNGGGDLTLRGGSHLEAVTSLTFGTGGGHTHISREGVSTAKFALGAITRGQGNGFTMSLAEDSLATTTASVSNGILTGGILVGSNWAKVSGGDIVALAPGDYTNLTAAAVAATTNYELTGSLSRGAASLNSLRIVGTGTDDVLTITSGNLLASQVSVAGNTYGGGASGGFLYVGGGNNNYTITGSGNLGAQNGNQEVIIHTLTGTLTVDMILAMGNTNGPLTKSGAGTLVLTKNNTYTAATYVNQGALQLRHANAAGTATNTLNAGIIVANNAALELANGITVGTEALTITGTGVSNGGAVRNVASNTSSYAGAITVGTSVSGGGARINSDTGGTLTLTGGVVTSQYNDVTFGGDGNTIVSTAAISGAGGVIKDGAGTTTLTATNTYTGATTVAAGVLSVNGSLASASSVTVQNGGTLQGSGSIGGSVTIQSGGTFAAGNSIESLATGTLSLGNLAAFLYDTDKDALASVAGDLTAVTGDLHITSGALLTLNELGTLGSWLAGEKLTVISYSGTWDGGLFDNIFANGGTGGALADGATFNFSGVDWIFNYNDTAAGDNYTGDLTGTNFVTMTAVAVVPEPGAALIGSLGLLALLRRRRR